jgi:predicted nucleotidyltransferase
VVDAALAKTPLRAAILVGSAGRGDADFFSDLDLLIYVDELPSAETTDAIREAVGGTNAREKEATEHARGEKFDLEGVRTELVFFTVERIEWRLDQLRDRPEEVDGPLQKVHGGLLNGLALDGEELVERWQARLRDYPEPLRRLLVERHWKFLPLWYHHEEIAARDAELWRIDALLDAAFNLLAVLAALNRIYFARLELKRTRALVASMERAPPNLADRLESLFRLEPEAAAEELGLLVVDTQRFLTAEFPDLDFDLEFPPGTRKRPWA